ncbi:hypothetical protein XELAEV_18010390mg [Xenopus laevis]|uniref:Uncharacterized protein n=1 Tax=Xenopus laevis TaxID=8355 RepID=A0A974DV94_XENLA|nr:hypothetical protein XELAEV_18010390mg [Xenopus laevis]
MTSRTLIQNDWLLPVLYCSMLLDSDAIVLFTWAATTSELTICDGALAALFTELKWHCAFARLSSSPARITTG